MFLFNIIAGFGKKWVVSGGFCLFHILVCTIKKADFGG